MLRATQRLWWYSSSSSPCSSCSSGSCCCSPTSLSSSALPDFLLLADQTDDDEDTQSDIQENSSLENITIVLEMQNDSQFAYNGKHQPAPVSLS